MTTYDDDDRRAYWAKQLHLGYALIEKVLPYEVCKCGEGFASIPDAAKVAGVEMTFSGSRIVGDFDRLFFIRLDFGLTTLVES